MQSRRPSIPEGLVLGLALLSSFVLMVGGLWFLQTRTSTGAVESTSPPLTRATTTAPPVQATPSETTQPPTSMEDHLSGCPEQSPDVICDLVHFVESVRGRPFVTFPQVELAEDADFDARLLSDFDEEVEDLARSGQTLRSLGLIGPDDDLVQLFRASLEVGVVGFYRTETQELVVRGSDLGIYEQSVLVHELVHAFDDQWFGLDRPEFETDSDESGAGFIAIIEGNASRVEDLWVEQLDDEDLARLRSAELTTLSPADIQVLRDLPRFILEMQISPYTDGLSLVEAIEDRGGEAAIDGAFDDPPRSTEQVLHPEDFFGREPIRPVDAPLAVGTLIDEGVFGELGLRAWLGVAASAGWGGDRYLTYENDDQVCTQVNLVMDTDRDLAEALDAGRHWAAASDPAQRTLEQQDETLVFVGCVPAGS